MNLLHMGAKQSVDQVCGLVMERFQRICFTRRVKQFYDDVGGAALVTFLRTCPN